MEISQLLCSQYHAALAMLREEILVCPEDVWSSGTFPRTYSRIAYHTLFYTDFYLCTDSESFVPWRNHRPEAASLYASPETALDAAWPEYSKLEMLEYLDELDARLNSMVNRLDLTATESGFSWYPVSKLEHQLINVRHIQQHVGQLSEICYSHDIELTWVGRVKV